MFSNCQETGLYRLEKVAIEFSPQKNKDSNIPKIGYDTLKWDTLIYNSFHQDSLKTNQFLTLILLKLYNSHINCCNQAYSLSLKNPVVDQFLRINGFYKSKLVKSLPNSLRSDLVWSSLVYDWLKGDVGFLNKNYKDVIEFPEIKKEFLKITEKLNQSPPAPASVPQDTCRNNAKVKSDQ